MRFLKNVCVFVSILAVVLLVKRSGIIDLLLLAMVKTSLTIFRNLTVKSKIGKIFEGGMLLRIIPTTLLQIFCKSIDISKVITKSIVRPDDRSQSHY